MEKVNLTEPNGCPELNASRIVIVIQSFVCLISVVGYQATLNFQVKDPCNKHDFTAVLWLRLVGVW